MVIPYIFYNKEDSESIHRFNKVTISFLVILTIKIFYIFKIFIAKPQNSPK